MNLDFFIKNKKSIAFLVLAIIVASSMYFWEFGELINIVVLIITAVIVFYYTKAAQRSNEIQERPILNLYLRESRTGSNIERVLKLRNVGNGPAYSIKFFGIEASGYKYYPHFDEVNPILEKGGDEKAIDLWVTTPTGGVEIYEKILGSEIFLGRLFDPESIRRGEYDGLARTAAVFLINYEGVNGNAYYSIFRIYPKIPPLLGFYDLVVEFIGSGQGLIDMTTTKSLCVVKPVMKKNEQ